MRGKDKEEIKPGLKVNIVLKQDQRTELLRTPRLPHALVTLTVLIMLTLLPTPAPARQDTARAAGGRRGGRGVRPLDFGKTVKRKLEGCDAHVYEITLGPGQYLRVEVLELGVAVVADLSGPGGERAASRLGNRSAAEMVERAGHSLSLVARTTGAYLLTVRPASQFCYLPPRKGEPQRFYEVSVAPARSATPEDSLRVAAEAALQQSFDLQSQNTAASEQKAIESYLETLRLWRAVGDKSEELRTLIHLGFFYQRVVRDYAKALERYGEALSLARSTGDRPRAARLSEALGELHLIRGRPDQARDFYEQALALRRETGDRVRTARLLMHMGIFGVRGRDDGVEDERESLGLFRAAGHRRAEVDVLRFLGGRYRRRGEARRALEHLLQALTIYEKEYGERGQFDLRNEIALLYVSLGERERAHEFFNRNLTLARSPSDPQRAVEGNTLNDLAYAHIKWGEYREAVALLEQALGVYRSISHRAHEAVALNNLGFAHAKLNDPRRALGYYNQALVIHREAARLVSEGDTLANMMDAGAALGSPRLAIFYGKQAVNAYQAYRTVVRGDGPQTQRSFIASKAEVYHRLAELLIAEGRLPEAQQVLDLLKEEEYFDFLREERTRTAPAQERARARATATEAEWEKRYREIADRVTAIGRRHGELRARRPRSPSEEQLLSRLDADLAVAQRAFEDYLDRLFVEFGASALAGERVFRFREAQGLMEDLRELGHGAVALYTLVGEEKYRVILVTPDVQKAYEYPVGAAELRRKVAAFREALQNPARDPLPAARELYRILLGPLATELKAAGAETLMWSLDGVLRYLPVAALHDGERYMVERFRNVVFTPASQARLKDRPTAGWRGLGLGVSKARAGFAPLPGVPGELQSVIRDERAAGSAHGVLPGKIILDEAFTEDAMKSELRQGYPVVHIASHFSFHPGDEQDSFLLLGDGRRLSLDGIKASANLFGGVELLTLSACDTALGGAEADGSEVEGFGVLAQRQGAKAVIASLWPVTDNSTRLLMRHFYRARGARASLVKSEALRQAQISLLRGERADGATTGVGGSGGRGTVKELGAGKMAAPYSHPYYWAPFILIGNWK